MATCRRCLCARPGQHVTLWWIGSTASSGASNVLGYSTLQLQGSTTTSPSRSCPQLLCTQQPGSAVCPSLRFVRAKIFNEVFSACSALAHRHTHTHTARHIPSLVKCSLAGTRLKLGINRGAHVLSTYPTCRQSSPCPGACLAARMSSANVAVRRF